jgi:hypothetical protein
MRTIRRLYFYLVALISLEIVLWGLIGLARSILSSLNFFQAGASQLAQALALVLVGVPVFLFHWLMIQRFARREMDERSSGLRAAFLYGVLLGTLIPVVQNIIALVNRPVLVGLNLPGTRAFVGGSQVWSDNLIAILMNLLVAVYFLYILRGDWQVIQPAENFTNMRCIYRWVWMVYGLGLTVTGVDEVLRFLLGFGAASLGLGFQRYWAVNGIVLSLVGTPIWVYAWFILQKSLSEPGERQSLLRLGMLYLLSLTGAVVTLASGGVIVDDILRLSFGLHESFPAFLRAVSQPLALCIPFLGIWLYYGGGLNHALAEVTDTPRRAGMRRVYYYILSGLGLTVAFLGLVKLVSFLVNRIFSLGLAGDQIFSMLSAALALLAVGIPLWLIAWHPMQAESLGEGDAGDHARRSITRKIYLYLALFAGVIGGMITAVMLFNILLRALFGGDASGFAQESLTYLGILILFIGLGVYHGLLLRRDGKIAARALGEQHAAFPVWIFDPGDGFGPTLQDAIHKAAPHLPISLQPLDGILPQSALPQAILLPSDVALDPPVSLRKWLERYNGARLVVPRDAGRWTLIGGPARLPVNQAAQALRQLAEGQEVRSGGTPAWLIVIYIFVAVSILPFLASLIINLLSNTMR